MKTALTTFTSNSRKRSCQKFHDYLACEFTVHYACRNAENDESTTTNGFIFRIKFMNPVLGDTLELAWL